MYTDNTTQYCVAETIDILTNKLNNALADLKKWCDNNLLVPHLDKCKAMIMQRQPFIGPIQALRLGNNTINWTTSEQLLGVHVDNKMTWSDHVTNVAKSFASKLSLLRRMQIPLKAIGRLLYKSYIANGHTRPSCLGMVQQDTFQQSGKTTR